MRPCSCVLAAVLASAAGCAHPPSAAGDPAAALPVLAATREDLARLLDAEAGAVASVKGTLALSFEERRGGDPRACSAKLAAREPGTGAGAEGLYLQGYRSLVPTLFTLVSDGRRFWLHVPRDDVVYTGPVAGRRAIEVRGLRLQARDLLRALFLAPVGDPEALQVEEEADAYVVSTRRDGRVERRLWVERRRFTVRREAFLGPDGREELSIERDRWVAVAGHLYPERLRLRDEATGASLTLVFERLTVNPADLRGDAFRPLLPPGARVVVVGDGEEAT